MLTKLEAVNRLLAAVSEAPVNSLTSGLPDAEIAESFLDRKTGDVLAQGWDCNTDEEVLTAPNADSQIPIASDWISAEPSGRHAYLRDRFKTRRDPSDNALKLFDSQLQSFTVSNPVTLKIVRNVPYEDLTYNMRWYIAALAAGEYQKSVLGSKSLSEDLREDSARATAAVMDEEIQASGANYIYGNAHGISVAYRNTYR